MNPKIHLTAYEDRQQKFIFVAVPDECGRYLRTTKTVAMVECPYCKSIAGEPCKSKHGYTGMTHVVRDWKDAVEKLASARTNARVTGQRVEVIDGGRYDDE